MDRDVEHARLTEALRTAANELLNLIGPSAAAICFETPSEFAAPVWIAIGSGQGIVKTLSAIVGPTP